MASIDEGEVLPNRSLITLTYPGQYPACAKEWKRHLDTLLKRLQRKYMVQAVIWKLEPQKRGAPHYHLLAFTSGSIDRTWVAQAWYEVVGSQRIEHLLAGTQCDPIKSWRGVICYASKYLAKVVEESLPNFWSTAGRWWGVRGKLPIQAITQTLTRSEGFKVRRVMRRYLKCRTGRKTKTWGIFSGLAVFLADVEACRLLNWALNTSKAEDTTHNERPIGFRHQIEEFQIPY